MKKGKKIAWILGIVVAVLVLLIAGVLFFLDKLVKTGVETIGPKLAGVSMTVGTLDISLLSGKVDLENFVIGNPEGYTTPHAIKVGKVVVQIEPLSVLGDKIVIRELTVDGVDVNFETSIVASNLNDILNNLNRFSSDKKNTEDAGESADDDEAAEASKKKLQIDKIALNNNMVSIVIKGTGAGAPIPLPPINLENLGQEPEGTGIVDVSEQILSKLLTSIADAGKGMDVKLPEVKLPEIKLPEVKLPESLNPF